MTRDEKKFLECLEAKQKRGELQWNRLSTPSVSNMILAYLGTRINGYNVILKKLQGFSLTRVSLEMNDESGKQVFELLDYGIMIPVPRRLLRFFNTVSKSVVRHELAERDKDVAQVTHRICTEER